MDRGTSPRTLSRLTLKACGGIPCATWKRRLGHGCLATALAYVGGVPVASAADPTAPADITITTEVVASGVEPLGANLTTIAGGTNFATNNLIWGGGFEPIVWRKLVRIESAGTNWIEWSSLGGVGDWDLSWTGFGNGATVRFYRIVDANGAPLAYAGGLQDVTGADRVAFLGEDTVPLPSGTFPDGGWIADDVQQRVYLTAGGLGLTAGDYAFIVLETNYLAKETSAPDYRQYWFGDQGGLTAINGSYTAKRVAHPGQLPAEFTEPGQTCLEITVPTADPVTAGQLVYHPHDQGEGQYYSQLYPGASYRVEVWLRQEGLGDSGNVRFVFTGSYDTVSQSTPWAVTSSWQKYTYDFMAPDYPASEWHIAHALSFTGPGKLWVDNWVLYRNDAEHGNQPFGPHRVSFDELMASMPATGPKPAIRFYPLTYSFKPHARVESMFGNHPNSAYEVSWSSGVTAGPPVTIAQALNWAYQTGTSPQTRAVPYLTCPEEYTEAEWRALVEYLGVPYDPAVDTPTTKPHAYQRYLYRGNVGTPWTDEFRQIMVEYGNETWHNGGGGYGWDGFGPPGYVHYGGIEYGLFARFMFDDNVMKMPEWSAHSLSDKIKFVLGANYTYDLNSELAYGELAVQQGATIAYLGHANYVGPKWETGDTGFETFNDHGVQETLIGAHTSMKDIVEGAAGARDTLNTTANTNYQLIAYEGGPSGYWQNPNDPWIDELYGKSLAMGVAALDAWLLSSENGYRHQCYLGFAAGKWWTSHTMPEAGGFRAHAGWLALKMRNQYALGDEMVKTVINSAPSYTRAGSDIPLISAYTLRNSDAVSVFVLSRKLDGNHDGVDFGDGYTPVTLHLPFEEPTQITLHRLANTDGTPADPRNNNLEALNLAIVSEDVEVVNFSSDFVIDEKTGGETGGLPPGTAYLYVFQLTGGGDAGPGSDAGDAGPETDAGSDAGSDAGAGPDPSSSGANDESSGCDCRLISAPRSPWEALWALLCLAALAMARRFVRR